MNGMRKFIFSFLVVLMLTPSLACAMPTCASDAGVTAEQPCADHNQNNGVNSTKADSVDFLLDCMGVDLQQADATVLSAPNLETTDVVYPFSLNVALVQFEGKDALTIRGPPDRISLLEPKTPIFQTTQRFRI